MEVVSCLMHLAMVLAVMLSSSACLSVDPIASFEDYCHDSGEDKGSQIGGVSSLDNASHLGFRRAFFTGGSPLFDPNVMIVSFRSPDKSAFLAISNATLHGENERARFVVNASLLLRNRSRLWLADRSRVSRHARARQNPFLRPGGLRLSLKGLWFPRSGTLCMAGCVIQAYQRQPNASDCKVKALFRYPLDNTVQQPLVKGTVQSMRDASDPLFFEQMSVTAIYEAPFVFKDDGETANIGAMVHANVPQHVNVWKDDAAVCEFVWSRQPIVVSWDRQCTGQDCSPFKAVGPSTSSILFVENLICSQGKVHGFFIFKNILSMPVEPWFSSVHHIVAIEGVWNSLTGQLNAKGCYLEGATNSYLTFDSKDCDIVITLQFPITLELTFRYSVIGRVERKSGSLSTPFKPFCFTENWEASSSSIGWKRFPFQLEYAYRADKIMQATRKCQSSSPGQPIQSQIGRKKLKFPDGQNFGDLTFPAIFKVSSGPSNSKAQFSPVSINQRINNFLNPKFDAVPSSIASHETGSLNVSFDVVFFYNMGLDVKFLHNTTSFLFTAEGVYDPIKGLLCLSACRSLVSSKAQGMSKLHDAEKDCEMLITVLLPPTNPGYFDKHQISGQLSSLRDQNDALFFRPVDLTSGPIHYQWQAAGVLIQMNLEVVLEMITLTMTVLFIGLQLRHVKKYPKVLRQISLLMLSILTLGHLIPLVLNFEAIFIRKNPQNILRLSGSWLEIDEVIVRLMTMVVFLMLIRLLYLSYVSKCEQAAREGPWYWEKNLFLVCLITYVLAGLSAMILYGVKGSKFLNILKGFLGLTIDFFLFPQVVGNYVREIHDRILSCPFYMGMTFVRTLPHVYDIVRKLEFFWIREGTYYFASPIWDFDSNVWDFAIPCGGLILAVLVFCQQRYGGTFFSVTCRRQRTVYNKVSMNPI